MIHTGTCANCGTFYTRNRPLRGTTCSPICRAALFKRKRETRICMNCGASFETTPASRVRHCSIACFNRRARQKADMVRTCEKCGKSYKRKAGQTRRRFCSRHCAIIAQHGPAQLNLKVFPRGRGTLSKTSNSNKVIRAFKETFPFCQRCGWREEPTILHVHHKDRNRANRFASNLEVLCPTCHVLEHYRAGDAIWKRAIN
jgi:5-methylcytosine-specific restriction endonuclease McrA